MLPESESTGQVGGLSSGDLSEIHRPVPRNGQEAQKQEQEKVVLQYEDVLLRLEMYIMASGSARKFARECELSEIHISKVRSGRALAGPKLLKAIGLRQLPATFEEVDWV